MPAKKKISKSAKKSTEMVEKQMENIESNLDSYGETMKKIEEETKKEDERKQSIEEKTSNIRDDLKTQLINQNKFGKQFDDLVEDYVFFVRLKEDLQYDIKLNGIRYKAMTGNGFASDKPNESVQQLVKVNAQMLKILQDLDLKAPDENPEAGDKDDLLS